MCVFPLTFEPCCLVFDGAVPELPDRHWVLTLWYFPFVNPACCFTLVLFVCCPQMKPQVTGQCLRSSRWKPSTRRSRPRQKSPWAAGPGPTHLPHTSNICSPKYRSHYCLLCFMCASHRLPSLRLNSDCFMICLLNGKVTTMLMLTSMHHRGSSCVCVHPAVFVTDFPT